MFQGAGITGLGPRLEKAEPLVCNQMCMCISKLRRALWAKEGEGPCLRAQQQDAACCLLPISATIVTVWKDFLTKC